ncbi:GMC family oxidoreductase N-terminal domain-containing protein [Microbacterium sp.]|uniref:GMC family oxidoreductase N-terminal domain-containing protein n=1 Tax=Microbacterium sp. TaxID=51671 RepID=UPI002D78C0D1|nr:GMC family oxidoreductase N-terminal domain-containing protein [Microbacterium sp.]HET6302349.1 GMC family oxidoreductase N-terminal domain-containing protein [Microbacterium sp.]
MTRVVVVGGGAAGAPLAARLSEDPDREVVLVEAGPAPERFPADLLDGTTVQGAMPGHPFSWSYLGHLTPDLPYTIARGRVLGGSSAINGGYFVRARPGDFERWADAAGPAWSYERALPVLKALESDRDFGPGECHGSSGPMPVARPRQDGVVARAFTAAARELGFTEEPDKNAPGAPGIGPVPANVIEGVRVNTALAYLAGARDRPNLRIVADTRVLRVRFEGSRAVGVETTSGVIEGDEVVLCAGAIGTPHLLFASGVGPRAHLESVGVRVVSDLPVGEAFSDHPDIAVGWKARRPVFDPGERFAFPTALNFSSGAPGGEDGDLEVLLSVKPLGYLLTGSTRTFASGLRAVARHPIRTLRGVMGASARRMAAQLAHADDLQLIVGLQRPEGRGSITLQSDDPTAPPRIDYRYLEEESDLARMRVGIRTAAALLRSDAFDGLLDRLTELDDATLDDDARLDAWMRAHLGTAIHLCGSAPMGPVLDGEGRVHGVEGLRVADTSMLPDVPSRGPFATAVFIGEHVARLMRG